MSLKRRPGVDDSAEQRGRLDRIVAPRVGCQELLADLGQSVLVIGVYGQQWLSRFNPIPDLGLEDDTHRIIYLVPFLGPSAAQ